MLQGMHDAKDVRNFVPIVEGGIIGNTVAICGLITVADLVRSFGVVRHRRLDVDVFDWKLLYWY
eukprot:scaffold3031_cov116-Amphora_coffeaeformis.AAC.2